MHPNDPPPGTRVVERLIELLDHPADQRLTCIMARCEHGVKSVDIDRPTLALVLRGSKQVSSGRRTESFVPGDLLAMAPGARLDVVNRPDPVAGSYLTLGLPVCDEVLAAARLLCADLLPPSGQGFQRVPLAQHALESHALAQAMASGDEVQGRMAVLTLLTRLARQGFGELLLAPPPRLATQLRQRVADAPARAWQSADFEQALGLSGATLRRRLAAEGTSLRELVAAARLARGLELLYTTTWPVKTVAARVGYRSAESFSRRFRERYGLEPGAIGNAAPDTVPAQPAP